MICVTSGEKFATTAPIAMHNSRDDKSNRVAMPMPANTNATISDRRLPTFLKKRSGSRKIKPSAAPTTRAPPISRSGDSKDAPNDAPASVRPCATATASENRIRAVASSMATTDSSVSVTGPFARYCLMTMMVAAGAVAAAIAPSTSENGSGCLAISRPSTTNTTANSDSRHAMTIGATPTRLK